MSVMATTPNSMTSPTSVVPGRVSAIVSHMDELSCIPSNFVSINGLTKEKLNDVSKLATSTGSNYSQHMGRINAAFEDYDDDADYERDEIDASVQPYVSASNNESHVGDEEHVYANFSEIIRHDKIEDIDRKPIPPTPTPEMQPLRIMPTGWREYKTLGGRTFYFHPEKNVCQWKPPRNPKNFHQLSQILLQQQQQQQSSVTVTIGSEHRPQALNDRDCEPSTSADSALFGASDALLTPSVLRHEYDQACCFSTSERHPHNSGDNDAAVPEGMVSFHSAMLKAFERENEQNKQMSQSVNGALLQHGNDSVRFYHHNPYNSLFNPTSAAVSGGVTHFSASADVGEVAQTLHNELQATFRNDCDEMESGGAHSHQQQQQQHQQQQQQQFSATPIRQGTLEKCRLSDAGVRAKKKEWTSAYAYLYSSHLLFYKDQKSAEKTGKHYPAPTDVCDLRGAVPSYVDSDKQKDKRRKHIISLLLANKTEYLFSCSTNESEINEWFHALRHVISALPSQIKTNPLPTVLDCGISLPPRGSIKNKALSKTTSFGSTKSAKSKLRKSSSKDSVELEHSPKQADQAMTRESIIERLLRFFRSRPSMESLRDRGIYKPEPVFGSTLSAICSHEKTMIPRFISEVTRLIEERGLDIDGLYRVNGNLSSVQKIRCQIDQDKYEALQAEEDVHVLTGSLKLFFRELSEPLFPISMNREFMSAIREPNGRQRFKTIDELLLRLPEVNRETLKVLVSHLERVATNSGKNRMQIHNLAIMFGPTLFGTEDRLANRKSSIDSGKGRNTRRKSADRKDDSIQPLVEPNQNLAYKMVIYGQIIEFVLNEAKRFTLFTSDSTIY